LNDDGASRTASRMSALICGSDCGSDAPSAYWLRRLRMASIRALFMARPLALECRQYRAGSIRKMHLTPRLR
jgi:hypothetical protein